MPLGNKPSENIVGKGEMACTSNFSFCHNVFYSIKDRNYHFCYIWYVFCKCFQFGLVQILSCGNGITLSKMTQVRLFRTQESADDNFEFAENGRKFSKWVEKHCGKWRNCLLLAISLFPTVFLKRLIVQTGKNQGLFGKGLTGILPITEVSWIWVLLWQEGAKCIGKQCRIFSACILCTGWLRSKEFAICQCSAYQTTTSVPHDSVCWWYGSIFYHPIMAFNSFPNDILDSSKLKESADDNFKFDENGRTFSKHIENTVGKGEIALFEQFLLFPQWFQKTCTADM